MKKLHAFLARNGNLEAVNPKGHFFKGLALLLIGALTIATSGVVVSKHICRGQVKSVGVYTSAESCDMTNEDLPCKANGGEESISKKPCCLDKTLSSKLFADFNVSQNHLVVSVNEGSSYTIPSPFPYRGLFRSEFAYFGFDPPRILSGTTILYQVFRL